MGYPWIMLGDFNQIAYSNKKLGGNPPSFWRIEAFRDFWEDCNLTDLGCNGLRFTWSNMRRSMPIFQHLDRALASPSLLALFPNAKVLNLPKLISDHSPILLHLNPPWSKPPHKTFKLEPMWYLNPSFKSLVNMS